MGRASWVTTGTLAVLLAGWTATGANAQGRCGDPAQRPWCDTSLSADARAGLLVAALTPAERATLLGGDEYFGVLGGEHSHTGTSTGIDRVGMPTTLYSDGPVGPRQGKTTALPIPMALAATFDPAMARRYGDLVANEVKAKGNDVVFAPTVNIMRTPLGGRTFEGFGEDPFLVSQITVPWIEGAQAQGVIANVKHFAANNQEGTSPGADAGRPGQPLGPPSGEGNRMAVDVRVDERTLREIELPAFEAAVTKAKVGSVMCSYNRLNGQYACENRHLLTDILKHDWGFAGYVLSDYVATHSTVAQLANGLDFEPYPGFTYSAPAITAAVDAGQATQASVDEHLRRILRTFFAAGAMDRPAFRDDDAQIDKPAHARTSRAIEEGAITLLKNDGAALPLDAGKLKRIAVIGADADTFKTGGGSGSVTPFAVTTPRQAITQRAGPGVRVDFDAGDDVARAVALAKQVDVPVVFAGDYQSEGADRACLSLECPNFRGDQDGLIAAVAAANPRTVVVLETGGPVLTPWRDAVHALVEAWYPGQEGGAAIARVLFGDADPGGRLPATFPKREADLPTAGDPETYPGVAETERYKEGVLVGYRHYDAKGIAPAYAFGSGLSYTRFAYSGLRIAPAAGAAGPATVSAVVRNAGDRAGVEVPQLYLGLPSPGATVPQPPRALKGFAKVALKPGERRRVRFALDERAFSYYDVGAARFTVAGATPSGSGTPRASCRCTGPSAGAARRTAARAPWPSALRHGRAAAVATSSSAFRAGCAARG